MPDFGLRSFPFRNPLSVLRGLGFILSRSRVKPVNGKMYRWSVVSVFTLFLGVLLLVNRGSCAEESIGLQKQLLKNDTPLQIASDRMEANQKERTILFEGHVVVQQDNLTITGKRLTVHASQGAQESLPAMMDQIDRIEVEGEVKISQEDKIATAHKAVYYHKEQRIVLSGNPRVSQGQNTVQGNLITLYLLEERSVVEGGAQVPVQAVLHPSKNK